MNQWTKKAGWVLGCALGVSGVFAATTINLAETELAASDAYTVSGGTVTLVKRGEAYTLKGTGKWNVKAGADCYVTLSSATNAPTAGAALDADGHTLRVTLTGTSSLTGASAAAGLQVNAGSTVTIDGSGTLVCKGNGGAASLGSASGTDAGTLTILSGTIDAQAPGNGGTAKCGAAIGAGAHGNGGVLTIAGGNVTATGTKWGVAIGAGTTYNTSYNVNAGTIRITGGQVKATGGQDGGAAIGGGHGHASDKRYQSGGGKLDILGGTVELVSGDGDTFATIGGGKIAGPGLDVTIDAAATVTLQARNNNNHQFGCRDTSVSQGSLKLTNKTGASNRVFLKLTGNDTTDYLQPNAGYVQATVEDGMTIQTWTSTNTSTATRTYKVAGGEGEAAVPEGFDAALNLSLLRPGASGENYTVTSDGIIELAANKKFYITGKGWFETSADMTLKPLGAFDITLDNVTIRGANNQPGFDVNGQTGTLRTLQGTQSTIWGGYPSTKGGISLENAASHLTLVGDGSLFVHGNSLGAAGIGGGRGESMRGTLVVESGTVEVRSGGAVSGGKAGAAIGGGYEGSGGTVVVNGGVVKAVPSCSWTCGIGAGSTHESSVQVNAGSITINGGWVEATGTKDGGAAIGCGHCADGRDNFTGGSLTVNGGTLIATGCDEGVVGDGYSAVIGGGKNSSRGMDVTIDVAATVVVQARNGVTVDFGSTRATEATKGTLTFTNKSGLTGFRRFLVTDVGTAGSAPVAPTAADGLMDRIVYQEGTGTRGFARAWALDLPSGVELLNVEVVPANGTSTRWTLNNDVYEVTGTEPALYVVGSTTKAFRATADAALNLAGVTVSTGGPAFNANGHAVTLNLENGSKNSFTATGDGHAGIRVNDSATLVVTGAAWDAENAGELLAQGRWQGAGLGGENGERCGTVRIEGGAVTAQTTGDGGQSGAGLGGGYGADGPVLFEMIDGRLIAGKSGRHGAGIGTGCAYGRPDGTILDAGHIVFRGGLTEAFGGEDGGAAIGGGHSKPKNATGGGTIEFLGGQVIATGAKGDSEAAVIGAGKQGGYGSDVTLDVSAYLEIHRGDTTNTWAIGSVGVGGFDAIAEGHKGSLALTNAKGITEPTQFYLCDFCNDLMASTGSGLARTNTADTDTLKVYPVMCASGGVGEYGPASVQDAFVDLATASGETAYYSVSGSTVTIKDGAQVTISGSGKSVVCAGDATVVLANATLDGFTTGSHAVDVRLWGVNKTTGQGGKAGLTVSPDGSVRIFGDGELTAQGNGGGAGIGGDWNMGTAGSITIDGGTINAAGSQKGGGQCGAGIGAGGYGSCDIITINDGLVNATGTRWTAAIGGSANANWGGTPRVGKITINGGVVNAKADISGGSAIGSGHEAANNVTPSIEIEINGGTVTAQTGLGEGASDFNGAVIGGGRKCTDVKVTISTAAKVTCSYAGGDNCASARADIGSSVPGTAGSLTIVPKAGTENQVFLVTSAMDVFSSEQVTLANPSVALQVAKTAQGGGFSYALTPAAGLVWTGAGDGVHWSDPANWNGTLDATGSNGTIIFVGAATATENDVGPIAVTGLRTAADMPVAIAGQPILAPGTLELEGEFTFASFTVGRELKACAPGATVNGTGFVGVLGPNYPAPVTFKSGTFTVGLLTAPTQAGAFVVGDAATVHVYEAAAPSDNVFSCLQRTDGTLVLDTALPVVYSQAQLGGAGTLQFKKGLLLAGSMGSANWIGSATFLLGGDVAGDMIDFHCIYGSGEGLVWQPMANDVVFDDTVSLEGVAVVQTTDVAGDPRTVTFARGLMSRAKGTAAGNVDIAEGSCTLAVKGSGAVKVQAAAVPGRGIAFNQNLNVEDTATFAFGKDATWNGSGFLSVGATATLAVDASSTTLPSVKQATFAAGATVRIDGAESWTGVQPLPLLQAATFTGKPAGMLANGKAVTTAIRDGVLYAIRGGLAILIR